MKKVFLLLIGMCMITGCQNVDQMTTDEALKTIGITENNTNVYRVGYKYYLPRGMQVDENTLYNEVITNNKYTYYLYIDMVSYYNEIESIYQVNNDIYYSEKFEYNDKFGYLEINLQENDKYLIEIMYNYAKIEVMVNYDDINESIVYATNLLKSIKYNDNIIENMLGEDILSFTAEEYNIFNTDSSESTILKYEDSFVPPEEEVYDPDLIN